MKEQAAIAFTQHVGVTARYGAVDLHTQKVRTADGSLHSLGSPDSWAISVSGFDMPQFGMSPFAERAGIPMPLFHNAAFMVDGRTGKVLQATWG